MQFDAICKAGGAICCRVGVANALQVLAPAATHTNHLPKTKAPRPNLFRHPGALIAKICQNHYLTQTKTAKINLNHQRFRTSHHFGRKKGACQEFF